MTELGIDRATKRLVWINIFLQNYDGGFLHYFMKAATCMILVRMAEECGDAANKFEALYKQLLATQQATCVVGVPDRPV